MVMKFSIKDAMNCIKDMKNIVVSQKLISETCIKNKDKDICKNCQINFSFNLLGAIAVMTAMLLTAAATAMSLKCFFSKPKAIPEKDNCCGE